MGTLRSKGLGNPEKWEIVVRSRGGSGKAAVWEWAIYREKGAVVPLCRGTITGAESNAYDAARKAEMRLLESLPDPSKKRKKSKKRK